MTYGLDHVVDPLLDTLVDRRVRYAIAAYLAGYKKRTREGYKTGLRRWVRWCGDHDLDPMAARREHINLWATELTEVDELGGSTVNGYLTTVCGWYRYMHQEEWIPANPAQYVGRLHIPRVSSTLSLTREELQIVLGLATEAPPHVDALVHLWGLNGTRYGETRAIDIEHLGMHGDLPTIHLPHRKGGVVSTISLSPPTARAVERARGRRTTGPLILSPTHGTRVGKSAARKGLQRVVRAAGIERRITPHSLRHTFVTLALDAGAAVRDIMSSTGHTDSSMVDYYDRARASIERNATHQVTDWVLTPSAQAA